ncbi:hypothetical protein [Streptosporangium roseum]|uniref:hypothetical protein n=1 Tax=Streptosporangium roseum TaxID=2001 RepID=UPI0012DD8897|nr:hypothetical protein [Streptosporangium roseum]
MVGAIGRWFQAPPTRNGAWHGRRPRACELKLRWAVPGILQHLCGPSVRDRAPLFRKGAAGAARDVTFTWHTVDEADDTC